MKRGTTGAGHNGGVDAITFRKAREIVVEQLRAHLRPPATEEVALESAAGRVLAEQVAADRDMPAVSRSTRDGFAVRSSDLPGTLTLAGEVRAGEMFRGTLGAGATIEIMTGAPLPEGADAVVMVEHVEREGSSVRVDEAAHPGQFISEQGSDAAAGAAMLVPGRRIDHADIALLAALGRECVRVYARPVVAILPTGDEIVEVGQVPEPFQVRNSNSYSLAAQVARAGGIPRRLPVARDRIEETRALIEKGLEADLLLLSGGVSAGRYDVVEPVLASLGAEFCFNHVLIQPGQPTVFGRACGKFFFGLPGNPASTMVTFELFARPAIELAGGVAEVPLSMGVARLACNFRHRPGLTRFVPARLVHDGAEIEPLEWHGSGDIPALSRASAFLVAEPNRIAYSRGDLIPVLFK